MQVVHQTLLSHVPAEPLLVGHAEAEIAICLLLLLLLLLLLPLAVTLQAGQDPQHLQAGSPAYTRHHHLAFCLQVMLGSRLQALPRCAAGGAQHDHPLLGPGQLLLRHLPPALPPLPLAP